MKMTLDPDLAVEAKALVAWPFATARSKICMPESHVRLAAAVGKSPTSPTKK